LVSKHKFANGQGKLDHKNVFSTMIAMFVASTVCAAIGRCRQIGRVAGNWQGAEHMTNGQQRFWESHSVGTVGSFLLNAVAIAWQIVRLVIVALLMFVEPILGFVFCGLAVVGVIVSVILKFSGAAPKFPFWSAIAISVGLYLAFLLYGVVVRALVTQPRED
jgi:hypothetical protein